MMRALSLVATTTLFSSQALASPSQYTLVSVPQESIDLFLIPGSEATGTPPQLQGLWWMNGNPLPDEVLSFAGVQFEPVYSDGAISGYEGSVPVFDAGIWSWHDTPAGRALWTAALWNRMKYIVRFDTDFSHAQVLPSVMPFPFAPRLNLPPSMLLDFTMDLTNENEFARNTILFGRASSYRFIRIVDGQGQRLPAYQDYVAAVRADGPRNALVPVCRLQQSRELPTPCAK